MVSRAQLRLRSSTGKSTPCAGVVVTMYPRDTLVRHAEERNQGTKMKLLVIIQLDKTLKIRSSPNGRTYDGGGSHTHLKYNRTMKVVVSY